MTAIGSEPVCPDRRRTNVVTTGSPCFPAGTLVTTRSGLRPVESLQVGDMVLTHKRRYRSVVQTMRRVADGLFTIKAMGAPVIITEQHPFYARHDRPFRAAEAVPEVETTQSKGAKSCSNRSSWSMSAALDADRAPDISCWGRPFCRIGSCGILGARRSNNGIRSPSRVRACSDSS